MENEFTKEQINFIKNNIKTTLLKKGTILYRAQSPNFDIKLKTRYDNDTGKTGIYFSNTVHIPCGHVLEYQENLNLYSYKTTKDLILYIGKYSYRDSEPEKFYKNFSDWKNKIIIKNIEKNNKKCWNHYDNLAYPDVDIFYKYYDKFKKINIAEIFISDHNDVIFIKKICNIDPSQAKKKYTYLYNLLTIF